MNFIDLSSFQCPLALVKLKMALKQIQKGDKIHILISDPGSKHDIPIYLKKMNHETLILKEGQNKVALIITK